MLVAVAAVLVATLVTVFAFEEVVNTRDNMDGNVTFVGLYLEDEIFEIWIENGGIRDNMNGIEIVYFGLYPEDKMVEILIENHGHEKEEAKITLYALYNGYSDKIVSDNCSVTLSPRKLEDVSFEYPDTPYELTLTVESPLGSGNITSRITYCGESCPINQADWLSCP